MLLYIIVFILLMILALSEVLLKNKKIVYITSGLMALMAGFRFYTGYDFLSYANFYQDVDGLSDVFNGSIDAESGYLFLNYLSSTVGLNFYFFILFFSLLSIGLLTNFLYRYTPYPSMFLFYYYARFYLVRDMGQIRSALACIILLYAIPYMLKQKPIKFLLVVIVASLFHVTALFFILAYIFNSLFSKLTTKTIISLLIGSVAIGVFIQIPQLYIWAIPDRYIAYFTNSAYTNGQWIMNPILWMQMVIFLGSFLYYKPSDSKEKSNFEGMLKVYFISSLILLAAGNLGTVGGRISTLFATSEIILVPYFLMNFSKNKLLNLLVFCGFSFIIFCLIFIFSGTYTEYVPYLTIFGV